MIKLLAVDMDGTCLDRRSRMTDATLEALRKAAGRGVIIVPTTGRNLECIPHRLAAGTLFTTGAMDEKKNKDLFRYVISSNGACVTDIRERKEIFRAPVPADDVLPLLDELEGYRGENDPMNMYHKVWMDIYDEDRIRRIKLPVYVYNIDRPDQRDALNTIITEQDYRQWLKHRFG